VSNLLENSRKVRILATITISLVLVVVGRLNGATIEAKSVSLADVHSAIALAHEGDTVKVPAGTASWTSALTITKGIILQGAGKDATIIVDDLPRNQRHGPPPKPLQAPKHKQQQQQQQRQPSRPAPSDGRSDPLPTRTGAGMQPRGAIVTVSLTPNQSFRMTGFTFRPGSASGRGSGPAVWLKGTCPKVRVDNCHFDHLYRVDLLIGGCLYGVIDHCIFDTPPGMSEILNVTHSNWGGEKNNYGDGSWAESSYFGSEKFIFIEDCVFNNSGGKFPTNGSIDSWSGGRLVVRHNVFNNTRPGNHGTETGGRLRACRAMEIYNNKIVYTLTGHLGQIRGGTAVIHDNILEGSMTRGWLLTVYREISPFRIWGAANGNNPWDLNDTEGNGTNVPGRQPHLYASGKHTGSSASPALVVSDAGWAPNQWVGFMLTNTTQKDRSGFNFSSYIRSNTSDKIEFFGGRNEKSKHRMNFNTGDGFAIYKAVAALDQPGRGKGDLISGNPPRGPRWLNQQLEPIYAWNNSLNGSPNYDILSSPCPTVKEGRDYYNNTHLPNYKPYTYPHPLVSGSPVASGETAEDRRTKDASSSSNK
jgi:hypothetical protein